MLQRSVCMSIIFIRIIGTLSIARIYIYLCNWVDSVKPKREQGVDRYNGRGICLCADREILREVYICGLRNDRVIVCEYSNCIYVVCSVSLMERDRHFSPSEMNNNRYPPDVYILIAPNASEEEKNSYSLSFSRNILLPSRETKSAPSYILPVSTYHITRSHTSLLAI